MAWAYIVLGCGIAFVLGCLSAYMDIDSYFKKKKVSYLEPYKCSPGRIFLIVNAIIPVTILIFISSETDELREITVKALGVSLGIPMLLRSKLFSFGQQEISAGLEAIYKFVLGKVLRRINAESGIEKNRMAQELTEKFENRSKYPDICSRIKTYVGQNPISDDAAELKRVYQAYQEIIDYRDGEESGLSTDEEKERSWRNRVEDVIHWAIDCTEPIDYIKRQLGELTRGTE